MTAMSMNSMMIIIDTGCRYLSMVSGFSHEPLACGILSSSSDIEGCRAVVSGVIWIRLLLDSARILIK